MNKLTRIQKISQIVNRDKDQPYGKQDILWEDRLEPMNVYKIPLEYLIYNQYNGRILSRTKSLESQGRKINPELDEDKKLIEKLLKDSNPGRNKQTLESLNKVGQEKVGIITRDGIIIDGNRRAMLLRQSGKRDYFKTVVLDVSLDEDPLAIEKLETTYQMGEDEKLGYNAIEKYLKAKGLDLRGVTHHKIADWMGETVGTIEQYLSIMKCMDDYLDYQGYNGIYTQLDEREDQFITLNKWLENFYGERGSKKAFDGYKNSDVDDLKIISFDYIRVKWEGKEFRNIADGLKTKHFFGNKTIWESFRDYHFKHIKPIKDAEGPIQYDSENLESYLNDRDNQFYLRTKNEHDRSCLEENIELHRQQVNNIKFANEPLKLVKGAIDSLEAINQKHPSFSTIDVVDKIEAINEKTTRMLSQNAPGRLLSRIIDMLKSIDIDANIEVDESLFLKVKEIEKIAYQIEKNLKDLE